MEKLLELATDTLGLELPGAPGIIGRFEDLADGAEESAADGESLLRQVTGGVQSLATSTDGLGTATVTAVLESSASSGSTCSPPCSSSARSSTQR